MLRRGVGACDGPRRRNPQDAVCPSVHAGGRAQSPRMDRGCRMPDRATPNCNTVQMANFYRSEPAGDRRHLRCRTPWSPAGSLLTWIASPTFVPDGFLFSRSSVSGAARRKTTVGGPQGPKRETGVCRCGVLRSRLPPLLPMRQRTAAPWRSSRPPWSERSNSVDIVDCNATQRSTTADEVHLNSIAPNRRPRRARGTTTRQTAWGRSSIPAAPCSGATRRPHAVARGAPRCSRFHRPHPRRRA